jgi:hypothetical protein
VNLKDQKSEGAWQQKTVSASTALVIHFWSLTSWVWATVSTVDYHGRDPASLSRANNGRVRTSSGVTNPWRTNLSKSSIAGSSS